jgi:membrane associated rhomboid family serine protease
MLMPPVTLALLIAVAAGHLAQLLLGDPVVVWFALWPIDTAHVGQPGGFLPWQLLTYAWLHGGL